MAVLPSWDLFVIIFGLIVVAYSFIIGRESTAKIIVSTYLAILTADGLGLLFAKYLMNPDYIEILPGSEVDIATVATKTLIFVILIVFLTLGQGIRIELSDPASRVLHLVSTIFLGVLSAELIIATLIVYLAGGSFILGAISAEGLSGTFMADIYTSSIWVRFFIDNAALCFAAPAAFVALLAVRE